MSALVIESSRAKCRSSPQISAPSENRAGQPQFASVSNGLDANDQLLLQKLFPAGPRGRDRFRLAAMKIKNGGF